jgi:hypothetical protein
VSKRRRKKQHRTTPHPVPVVILAVDPAAQSGFALFPPPVGMRVARPVSWGVIEPKLDARSDEPRLPAIIASARELAEEHGALAVLLCEDWATRGFSHKTYAGLCTARSAWEDEWERQARLPAERTRTMRTRARLITSTWKSCLGFPRGKELQKPAAVRSVASRLGIVLGEAQHDIADAMCIGIVGQRSSYVDAVLPKKLRQL